MTKNKITKLISMLLILTIVIGLTACGTQTKGENHVEYSSQLDKIKASGKIVLGTCADYPPYEFHKEIDGKDKIVGFDIRIAQEIAKDLGVELVIKDMKFDGLLAALDAGNVDFVVAGMTPTEERQENVDFSKTYYNSVQTLVIKTEDEGSIKSLQDLDGKIIGVQKGSIQQEIAEEQIPWAQIKGLSKISDLVLELKNNKTYGLIVAKPVANAYVSKNNDITIVDVEFEDAEEGAAVAVKKGDLELVNAINKTLDKLIENDLISKFFTEATEEIE